jgi:hypothetical protein
MDQPGDHPGWNDLKQAARALDRRVVFVLCVAVLMVMLHDWLGDRGRFLVWFGHQVPLPWRQTASWAWWMGWQGLLGLVIPVACLRLIFKMRPAEMGLAWGDRRLGFLAVAVYLPLAALGAWLLSGAPSFQHTYPQLPEAAYNWKIFLLFEAMYLVYWAGWEYLWRGFVLFGTVHRFGLHAVFVQMVPFALLHLDKPPAEALLSILGGVLLGALVWRCGAVWPAWPIHAGQMLFMDLWCVLRLRHGAQGVGWDAFLKALGA